MQDKFKNDINSAGCWFVTKYIHIVQENLQKLNHNKNFKDAFITKIFNEEKRDSEKTGTRVRVNSVLRLVNGNATEKALDYISHSKVKD